MHRIALVGMVVALAGCGGEAPPESSAGAAAAAGVTGSSGDRTLCVLVTRLSWENEVRTAANTNDPTVESTATGHAQVKVRTDGPLEIKVFILNQDAERFTAGHIHEAPAGVNGPVVVPLFSGESSGEHFVQHAEVAVPEGFDRADLCADPSAYYVNYHTTQDPVGATRGQLQ